MHNVVSFIIRFILAHDKTNAAFQFLSGEAFLKFSSIRFPFYFRLGDDKET